MRSRPTSNRGSFRRTYLFACALAVGTTDWSHPAIVGGQSDAALDVEGCSLLWGLEDLTLAHRRALHQACERGETVETDPEVAATLDTIIEGPVAGFALFSRAFQASTPVKLATLVLNGGSDDCTRMRDVMGAALSVAASDSERVTGGAEETVREVLDTTRAKTCLENATLLAEKRPLLSIVVGVDERVFVAYSGPLATFSQLAERDGMEISVAGRPRRLYVVVAPPEPPDSSRGTTPPRFRVRIDGPAHSRPDLYSGRLDKDRILLPESPRSGARTCLHLQVAYPRGGLVVLDGEVRVPRTSSSDKSAYTHYDQLVYVLKGEHQLLVLGSRNLRNERPVLSNRAIRVDSQSSAMCMPARFDLSPIRKEVGIMDEDVEAECLSAGLDQIRLHQRLREFLANSRLSFSDLHGVTDALQAFQHAMGTVNSAGVAASGAKRERLDLLTNLGIAASERLRQGVKKLLRLRVNCSHRRDDWTYAVSAVLIDLSEISRESRDPVTGISTEHQVQSEVEELTDPVEFRDGVVAPVARVLGLPYTRFLPNMSQAVTRPREMSTSASRYEQPIELLVASFVPNQADSRPVTHGATVRLRALAKDDAASLCDSVRLANSLQGPGNDRTLPGAVAGASAPRESGRTAQVRVRVDPPGAGTYLATITTGEPQDAREPQHCVHVVRSPIEVSLLGGVSFGSLFTPLRVLRSEQDYSINYLLASLGPRAGPALLVGVSNSSLRGQTSSSLDDIRAGVFYDENGKTAYTFRETSLLFGAGWSFSETLLCEWFGWCSTFGRRLNLTLRPSALLSIGLPSVDDIPIQLVDFRRDARQGVDADVFASIDVGFTYRVTPNYSFGLSAQLLAPKLVDLLRYPFAERSDQNYRSVTFDPRLAFALGARFSWWP